MLLSTKQVRAVARAVNVNFVHTYTDRTTKNKSSTRRSVTFVLNNAASANALYNTLAATIKNPIKRTGSISNYATRCSGYQYVRVIANI
jgi:hypothetical protein